MTKALMAIAALSLLGGCSSIPAPSAAVDDTADLQYVARVEQAAKRYGTQVVWINLPQKRTTPTQ